MTAPAGDAEYLLADALDALNVSTRAPDEGDRNVDLVILSRGHEIPVQIKRWATFPDSALVRNPEFRASVEAPRVRVVVADRITASARRDLADLGWGWFDLRGHLYVRADGLIIDADVPARGVRPARTDPLAGHAGLEVACAVLAAPRYEHSVRELSRTTKRSPSTVSEIVKGLRDEALVEGARLASSPELFWRVAGAWPTRATYLRHEPGPGDGPVNEALELGFGDDVGGNGWALTGTLAAAALGAPVVAQSDQPAEFFVPSAAIVRRATSLLGVAQDSAVARASIRVAPVPAVCQNRRDARTSDHRPLAAPLFVALDLAQDSGRGREILEHWDSDDRVW